MVMRLVLILVAMISLAGCKSSTPRAFAGDDRPDEQVAILRIDPDVRFVSLNGQSIKGVPEELGNTSHPLSGKDVGRMVRILPGEYRIVAGYSPFADEPLVSNSPATPEEERSRYPSSADDEEIAFTAKAGKEYLLKLDISFKLDSTTPTRWAAVVSDRGRVISRSLGRRAHEP